LGCYPENASSKAASTAHSRQIALKIRRHLSLKITDHPMLNRLRQALDARKEARQQAKLVIDGMKWGKTIGGLIETWTMPYKLDEVSFGRDEGAALCGYIYGFSDVMCQHVGLERGGLASINAAVTALNMIVPADNAKNMIERFLVSREFPHEFEQGMNKGAQGANSFLNKERWTPGLVGIVQALVKHQP
jgi:hypothetical protein